MQRKERAFLQVPTLPFHFWVLLLPSHLCPFISNTFSWHLLLLKQKKRKKTKKKNHREEKNAKKRRSFPLKSHSALSPFGSHFWLLTYALLFQTLSPDIFFFSSKKKQKNKKNHREKQKCNEGRAYFQAFILPSHFLLLLMASYFCHFVSNTFSSAFSSSQAKQKKKKTQRKKIQRREGAYFQAFTLPSHFWLLLLASCFCHFISSTFFFAFSSSQARKKNTHTKKKKKKTIGKKKKCKKRGRNLHFFFHFCIWGETFLLLSPFHIPSTLSSPPTSSLVSHISSKLYATQV